MMYNRSTRRGKTQKNNKVIPNLIWNLQRLLLSFLNNLRGRSRIKYGMTSLCQDEALNKDDFRAPLRSGFTLIELLVVVLIISILAAVAVPQYQKAVLKARLTQMIAYMDALKRGSEVYYMENGNYTNDVRALDLDITGKAVRLGQSRKITAVTTVAATFPDGTECAVTDRLTACLSDDFYLLRLHNYYFSSTEQIPHGLLCRGNKADAKKVCASLSNESGVELGKNLYYFIGN